MALGSAYAQSIERLKALTKRTKASRRSLSALALATFTRMVCCASAATSLPRAMMTSLPSASCCSTKGGTDQPTSICPDITWVSVAGAPPVATSLGVTFAWFTSCSRMRLVEEPGEENATVLPLVSARRVMPLSGRAYQNASAAPVASALMILDRHALGIGRDDAEDAIGHRDIDTAGDHRRERRGAAFGVENVDVEADVLEVALLEADVDEGAVPKAALGDRDLQGFGGGSIRRCSGYQPDKQNKCLTHHVLLQIR